MVASFKVSLSTPYTSNYMSEGIQLELLDNFCDLDIQIDSKLKFHIHTNTVAKKAYHVLGLICKLFECIDSDVMVKLCETLVCPIIEYIIIANVLCMGTIMYVLHNQKLERIQCKATVELLFYLSTNYCITTG